MFGRKPPEVPLKPADFGVITQAEVTTFEDSLDVIVRHNKLVDLLFKVDDTLRAVKVGGKDGIEKEIFAALEEEFYQCTVLLQESGLRSSIAEEDPLRRRALEELQQMALARVRGQVDEAFFSLDDTDESRETVKLYDEIDESGKIIKPLTEHLEPPLWRPWDRLRKPHRVAKAKVILHILHKTCKYYLPYVQIHQNRLHHRPGLQ